MTRNVIVIGGGAAGLMASLKAAQSGASVTLLERNEKPGRKIYITGKGRCNVTNDCTQDDFLHEVAHNPRFLYSALSCFTPQDMLALLEENGCPTVVERGRRAYPASQKASDVTRTLERMLVRAGVQIRLNSRVASIDVDETGAVRGVTLQNGQSLPADAVVLATGGLSYPGTGSTGDGFRIAAALGHTVMPGRASLCGVNTKETWPAELQGLALKNVKLTLRKGKKTLYNELGEMLFTHFGVSGPLVLEMSCHLPDDLTGLEVAIDLKPALDPGQLEARLQREFDAQPRKQLRSILPALLPGSMAGLFPALCGVDGNKPCAQVTREERTQIASVMKHLPLTPVALRPIEEAIVTRGGVAVKEIDAGTMQSKLVPGLYFAGEVIDVDAHTGGYNLQIAWSTGALAGLCCAEE